MIAVDQDAPDALEQLLAEHLDDLKAFISPRMGRDLRGREESSDLLQSVCRQVLAGGHGFTFESRAAFRRWLYTTAQNKLTDRRRYHGAACRDPRCEVDGSSTTLLGGRPDVRSGTPSHQAMAREGCDRMVAALRSLPEHDRQIVLLSRLAGLSHSEVAEQVGRSEGAVRTALYRALARLSLLLDTSGEPRSVQ